MLTSRTAPIETTPVAGGMTFKCVVAALYMAIFAVGVMTSSAYATVILNVTGGQLTGAQNVVVSGTLYDVTFVDGTCIALFSGCDAVNDFDISVGAANAAANALIDQVFKDSGLGLFDTDPELTSGCSLPECAIAEVGEYRVRLPVGIGPEFLDVVEDVRVG